MTTLKKNWSMVFVISILLIVTVCISNAFAQTSYPNKPITVIHPWIGGPTDLLIKEICNVVAKDLGQPIIHEFKAGANASISMAYVANSVPDGYTLGIAATSTMAIAPQINPVPYDVMKDITDVLALYKNIYGLAVKSNEPWNTYEDLIASARKKPRKIRFGTQGAYTVQHLTMERIARKEGIQWTHVPYKQESETISACLGGHIEVTTATPLATNGQIEAGKMKLLMVLTDTRWPTLPKVPIMKEKGYDFSAVGNITIYGPARLPEPIRQKLERAFIKVLDSQWFKDTAVKFGVDPGYIPGKEYTNLWKNKYYPEFGKAIKDLETHK